MLLEPVLFPRPLQPRRARLRRALNRMNMRWSAVVLYDNSGHSCE